MEASRGANTKGSGERFAVRPAASFRSVVIGLVLTVLVDLWIHYAELVLGGRRGHTALANSSIPVGPFNVFFALLIVHILLKRFLPAAALSQAELLTIYVMMTVSSVLSSSGSLHFLIPSLVAPYQFATPESGWAETFHRYIPKWFTPRNPESIRAFYVGDSPVPWGDWLVPIVVWSAFLSVFTITTICLNSIMRRQWVDRERLSFPTVVLPAELMREQERFLKNKVLWVGFAIPFFLGTLNTISLNVPTVPQINFRTIDLSPNFTAKPWNAIGYFAISFYPFVIGIGYLLSAEVTFSCWFFYLMTKAQAVLGAVAGWRDPNAVGTLDYFPYVGHQGAGAFLAILVVSVWVGRSFLKEVWLSVAKAPGAVDDSREAMSYRAAVGGTLLCFAALTAFCVYAGMGFLPALVLLVLAVAFRMSATRLRADAGNAWLFGPDVDANTLMTTTFGSAVFRPQDLTIMAFLRSISSYDLRTSSVPHQLDALKLADLVKADKRRLVKAMILAVVVGVVVSFCIALFVWYRYGAAAKTDVWRAYMGQQAFMLLKSQLDTPLKPNVTGTAFVGVGFLVTVFLSLMRIRFVWWPFHPVGYAVANTHTMNQIWLPFFIAWLAKVLTLRYGGLRLYRQGLPFFLGLILGDFLAGGLWTLIGCFTNLSIYPMNW
jgi:hypothetical protein